MVVPWPVTSRGHWYGAPVHKMTKGGHEKDRELTASLLKMIAASGMGSRDGEGGWRNDDGAVRDKSEQHKDNTTK